MRRLSKTTKAIATAVIILLAIAFVYVYTVYDPAEAGWFPRCPFRVLTGLQCPGCGSQRALHALFTGRPTDAWHTNPLAVASLPLIALLLYAEATRSRNPRLYRVATSLPLALVTLVAVVAFGVIRNLL